MHQYIMGLATRGFGRCAIASLKCRHLASWHQHQEHKYSVLDTQNRKHIKHIWSRSCNTKVLNKVEWDRLENVNELESADCKKNIVDLVLCYYDPVGTGQHAGDTSMSILDLYQIHTVKQYYDLIPEVQKHLDKSDGFQKLIEILPNHLENISIADQLDIYMGLELLGVPETNLTMNHLFCNFSKPKSISGLSELAKMVAIFKSSNISKIHVQTIIAPRLYSLLKNISLNDHDDCKNFALFLKNRNLNCSPRLLIQSNIKMLSILNHLNDLDLMLKVLNAIFSTLYLYRSEDLKNQFFLTMLKRSLDLVEPDIEKLTSSQVAEFLSDLNHTSVNWFNLHSPHFWKRMCYRTTKCVEEVLSGDLSIEEKNTYLYRVKVFGADIFTIKQKEIMDLFKKNKPTSNLEILKRQYYILQCIHSIGELQAVHHRNLFLNLNNQFRNILNFQKEIDLQETFKIMDSLLIHSVKLRCSSQIMFSHFGFLEKLLASGHACSTDRFFDMCKFGVPVLGEKLSLNAKNRIRDFFSCTDFDEKLIGIGRMLSGASYINEFHGHGRDHYAKEILKLATITLQNKKMNNTKIMKLAHSLRSIPSKRRDPIINGLIKVIADKLEYDDFTDTSFAMAKLEFLSEKNANRILREDINAFEYPLDVVLTQIFALNHISRYPKNKDILQMFARNVFNKYFDQMPIGQLHRYLLYLCNLDIYLDRYLQEVFSVKFLAKFDTYLESKPNLYLKLPYLVTFARLNRAVVLYRPVLNIPWVCEHIVKEFDMQFDILGLNRDVSTLAVQNILETSLGGKAFFKANVTAEYGVVVDFEFFLNSANKPVAYDEAKQMDHTKTDIQKVAVNIGRELKNEFLAEDVHGLSVYNSNMTKDLSALGYKVVSIQRCNWNYWESNKHQFLQKIFN